MANTLTCEQVRDRLTALQDGECEEGEAVQIEAHRAGCVECARQWEEGQALRRTAGAWTVETADLWPALAARIEAEDNRELLAELRAEMAQLKMQVRRLENEVVLLRRSAMPAVGTPSPLLPYTAPASRSLHLV